MSPAETNSLTLLAVLIPAWKPEARLIQLVARLQALGFGAIVIVDDGSGEAYHSLLTEACALPGVELLRHTVNLGKGRALKTGFNHLLDVHAGLTGVVTADADGQHTPEDIERVAHTLLSNGRRAVLGSRFFEGGVPLRSRVGNQVTRHLFAFLTGVRLADTQSGLRGLPYSVLPQLLPLEGERYEYEMTVLAHLCRSGPMPLEVRIATVYIENNRGSHFNPVRDSMRIYFVLLRFCTSSLLAASLDIAGFSLCFASTHQLLLSVSVGRLSSLVNFTINRRFVFHSHSSVPGALWRYYLLVAGVGAASYGLIFTLHTYAHWNVFAAKITMDVLLSIVSFSAQRTFVFCRGEAL